MMNDLKQAIKRFGPGQCPKCGNNLTLLNMDTISSQLEESGQIEYVSDQESTSIGICKICNETVPMKRVGLYFIPDYEIRRVLREDEKILDEFSSKIIKGSHSDNPFGREE